MFAQWVNEVAYLPKDLMFEEEDRMFGGASTMPEFAAMLSPDAP